MRGPDPQPAGSECSAFESLRECAALSFLFIGNSLIITAKIKQLIGSKTLLYID